jgi:hypothetical protein
VLLVRFVLFGHWMEMKARRGTTDSLRAHRAAQGRRHPRRARGRGAHERDRRRRDRGAQARRQGAGRREGVEGSLRSRREPRDGGVRACGEGPRGRIDRWVDQPVGSADLRGHQGRCGHSAGSDHRPRPRGAELQGARPAARRPRRPPTWSSSPSPPACSPSPSGPSWPARASSRRSRSPSRPSSSPARRPRPGHADCRRRRHRHRRQAQHPDQGRRHARGHRLATPSHSTRPAP